MSDWLNDRIRRAEKQMMRDRYTPPKKDWLKTTCPGCGYRISYIPRENWNKILKCPECQNIFEVDVGKSKGVSLDDFVGVEMNDK